VSYSIYKVIQGYLIEKKSSHVTTLINILKDVKSKKIKNENQFYIALETVGLDKKDFEKAVFEIIDSDNLENLLFLGFFLGEGHNKSGLDILKKPWWERNISDLDLKKKVPSKFWELFRNNNWVKQNKYAKINFKEDRK
jgi:hypothetical protein